jgi:RNA polymerase sigma factor (sigma-70 family)
MVRRGNTSAFEVLVSRYHARLLAFCRHLLGSREDAEDILQEVFAAAFNAMLADDRPINVRPWLYRIARNRSLNHLRRSQAIGVDSMDVHFSDNGLSTADKVHDREQFRLLVGDIHELPETQRTALVLREMDALSYEQIAEAMDTTVPGVKSLLVRARISLAEAAEARLLTCEDVRVELAEVAEGLRKRPGPLVRRHVRTCRRCASFQSQLKRTNRALAALLPIGPLALLRQLAIVHLGHSAGTGSGATAAGATGATGAGACSTATGAAAGQAACVAGTAGGALGGAGGVISAGAGAIATKAAGALAAAAIVTAGAVEATHTVHHAHPIATVQQAPLAPDAAARPVPVPDHHLLVISHRRTVKAGPAALKASDKANAHPLVKPSTDAAAKAKAAASKSGGRRDTKTTDPGRVQTETDPTVLASPATSSSTATTGGTGPSGTTAAAPASSSDASTGSSDATTGPTGPTGPSGTSTTGSPAPTGSPPPTDTGGGSPTDPGNGTQTGGAATSTGPTGGDGTTTIPGTTPGATDPAPIS